MRDFDYLLLSCEHAGNSVPEQYKYLFNGHEDVLNTHRGYDPGAFDQSTQISNVLNVRLHLDLISRLLIEPNRIISSHELFSQFSNSLNEEDKQRIIDEYYLPYRNELDNIVNKQVVESKKVIHLSIHSCTNELNGEVRNMDIGILFDPERKAEKSFAQQAKVFLNENYSDIKVVFNYPYAGISDGVVEWLRRRYTESYYVGLEFETNQKYFIGEDRNLKRWNYIKRAFAKALQAVLD